MGTVAFYTLGCKVNQYETEALAEAFEKAGYKQVDFDGPADVYVVNTCTVTGLSARKSRQALRKAGQLNAGAVVAAVGCYPQTAAEELRRIPGIDIIAGTAEKSTLLDLVEDFKNSGKRIIAVGNIMGTHSFEDIKIGKYWGRTRAFLKVQEGCNQFCSYCIIPYARGPARSKPACSVLEEVKTLAKNGFKEIVLTGIHLASYGKDTGQTGLLGLAEKIHGVEGIERIRLGSLEPTFITEELAEAVAGLEKLCPHYHISLQSGCDRTLKRMNRRYTTAEYKKAVDLLREYIPDVSVTTDIMVGFPGETDEEFEETFAFAEEMMFSKMHVFKFSPRKGTPAATMGEQTSSGIKEIRSTRLIELSEKNALAYNRNLTGRIMPVLYEQEEKALPWHYVGLTPNYVKVLSVGNNITGRTAMTRLLTAGKDSMQGEIVG